MLKLSIELTDKIRILRDNFGLKETEEQYDENHFGNAYLILTAEDFAIRILRDRGQVFADLAKPGGPWVDADKKLQSLGMHPNPESILSLEQLIDILAREKDRILQAL
jgi:hypothetical protein